MRPQLCFRVFAKQLKNRVGNHLDVIAARLGNAFMSPMRSVPERPLNGLVLCLLDMKPVLHVFLGETEISNIEPILMDSEVRRLDVSVDVLSYSVHLLNFLKHLYRHFLNRSIAHLPLWLPHNIILEVFIEVLHDKMSAAVLNVVELILGSTG